MSLLVRRPSFVQIVGTMHADQLVAAYQLAPHPKGGYYRDFVFLRDEPDMARARPGQLGHLL